MALTISVAALVVAALALAIHLPTRRTALRKRVMVNTLANKALEGVLYKRTGPLLILKDVTLHESDHSVKVDGEVVIESAQVEFVQVL